MNASIEQLLAELYQADPSLREKESVLRPLIAELLAGRPEVALDSAFRERLKGQLRARMAQSSVSTSHSFAMSKYSYGLVGGLIALVLAVPIAYVARQPQAELAFAPEVRTTEQSKAFGSLAGTTAGSSASVGGRGGGGDAAALSARPQSGGGGGGTGMVAPEYVNFQVPRFIYDGELTIPQGEVQVLARRKGNLEQGSLSRLVGSFNLGDMLNLKSFPGLGLQSVNLTQDREYGYNIFIDFAEGVVGVNQNWLRWPNPYAQCNLEANPQCWDNLRIRQDQLPADADAIAAAEQFLREHGVSTEGYGAPEVMQDWRLAYERAGAPEKATWYFPEQISVVWPLMVQGKPVYEEGGAKVGISVGIDVRTRRPVAVYNLQTQQYDSSAYEAQGDEAVIRRALQSGSHRPVEYGPGAQYADIPVNAPTEGWMRTWIPDAQGNGREVLVPALVFSIGAVPQGANVWQSAVVIPLAKELYNQQGYGNPMPMPLPVDVPQVESATQ